VFIYEGPDGDEPHVPRSVRHRWHAVTIAGTADACAAAIACKDKRYLSAEAPRLPLPGCDAKVCDCRYAHYDDRRRAPRRAQERGAMPKRVDVEQRVRKGRRATDHRND
jgi:hypothetical protein